MVWVAVVLIGALIQKSGIVWGFADVANAFMAVPNLIALLLLNGVIVAETRRYLWEGQLDMSAEDAHVARAKAGKASLEVDP